MKNLHSMTKKGLCIVDNQMTGWAKAILDNKMLSSAERTNEDYGGSQFKEPAIVNKKRFNNMSKAKDDDDIMSLKIENFERLHDEEVHSQCQFEGQRYTKEIDTISITDYEFGRQIQATKQ